MRQTLRIEDENVVYSFFLNYGVGSYDNDSFVDGHSKICFFYADGDDPNRDNGLKIVGYTKYFAIWFLWSLPCDFSCKD